VGAHQHPILETVVVGVRTVAEIHTLQVEEAGTKAVASGEVGVQAPADNDPAVAVVAAAEVDTGYAEAEVAGESTLFVAAENMCSVGVVRWNSRMASRGHCLTFLTQRRGHGLVAVEGVEVV